MTNTIQQRLFAAFLLTASFAIAVFTFGLLCAFIDAYWFWKPAAHGWVSSREGAFQFGAILAGAFTLIVSFLFGFYVFSVSILYGDYANRSCWRLCLIGGVWGVTIPAALVLTCLAFTLLG